MGFFAQPLALVQTGGVTFWLLCASCCRPFRLTSVLTIYLPSPAPPIKAAPAEHEYQDDYHNNERRGVHGLPLWYCHDARLSFSMRT